jgi:hypothetical protein
VTRPADPFDPTAPGRHVTDDGLPYDSAGQAGQLDFLLGRSVDVWAQAFAIGPGWPSILVELNLQMTVVSPGRPHGGDLMPALLAGRGLLPVPAGFDFVEPAQADRIRFTLRLSGKVPGIFGPGSAPGARWVLTHPPPPFPQAMIDRLPGTGGQIGLYVTTQTEGIARTIDPGAFMAGLHEATGLGQVYGTRAAVIP